MSRALWPLALVAALAGIADARPGGGDSFSGGGGFGGGDGGGDGGDIGAILELAFHLIRLCIYYPQIGVPLTVAIIGWLVWQSYKKQQTKDWDSGPPVKLQAAVKLDAIRAVDPDFSPILFEDFCFRLYATCQEARHDDHQLDGLAPYVDAGARTQLANRQPRGRVSGVVVGAMRATHVSVPSPADGPEARVIVMLELETNYTVDVGGGQRTYYAIERWKLTRAAGAKTRPRDRARGFPCPNCGAPWEADRTHDVQRCASCGEVVDNGRFDWLVTEIKLVHVVKKPPTLTTEVPERGTDLPTFRAPDADAAWGRLRADDPALTEDNLRARLHLIYDQVYAAWADNDLPRARRFLSDGLYDYLAYWMDAYRRQGLVNNLVGMRITHSVLAKVTRDRWYDAITIRIWGTGKDFVVRKADGALVRGSRRSERPYSEYWTLIRSAARRGAPRTDLACSNCGAPAPVAMTGACEHCGAHVTGGEFDWVLSKIEQDDTYRG